MSEESKKKTVWDEIEVAGENLVAEVKKLAAEGNVRQMKIISDDGDVFFESPLTVGLVVSGVVVLAAPWLAVLGVIAGLVKKVKIEVERVEEPAAEDAEKDPYEDVPV